MQQLTHTGICKTHLFYRGVFDLETFPLRKKPRVAAEPSSLEPENGHVAAAWLPQHPLQVPYIYYAFICSDQEVYTG